MTSYNLTHLKQLEAESIHIIREVVAEFDNPVMLYSIGKDSSVLVHLALKAFYPAPPPFQLLHVDTTWKFREMIEFRDNFCAKKNLDLRVHINKEGVAKGINPFDHGSGTYTDIMKTQSLKQALDSGKYDAAFGGVIVVKNPFHIPCTPYDGQKLYGGKDNYTYDNFGDKNTSKYYAVFTYDDVPNFSEAVCLMYPAE